MRYGVPSYLALLLMFSAAALACSTLKDGARAENEQFDRADLEPYTPLVTDGQDGQVECVEPENLDDELEVIEAILFPLHFYGEDWGGSYSVRPAIPPETCKSFRIDLRECVGLGAQYIASLSAEASSDGFIMDGIGTEGFGVRVTLFKNAQAATEARVRLGDSRFVDCFAELSASAWRDQGIPTVDYMVNPAHVRVRLQSQGVAHLAQHVTDGGDVISREIVKLSHDRALVEIVMFSGGEVFTEVLDDVIAMLDQQLIDTFGA